MKNIKLLTLAVFILLIPSAHAVPPPDFIINIGSQLAGVFGFIAVMLTAIFSISFQYLKNFFHIAKSKKLLIPGIIVIIILALSATILYKNHVEKKENQQWISQSQQHSSQHPQVPIKRPEKLQKQQKPPENTFWQDNQHTPLFISNADFKAQLPNNPYVLDARENIENEYGYFPGSHHIRFADLQDGQFTQLPKDQPIYVLCWSGMRGKTVAEFLRSQQIVAVYLQEGADGWYSDGGQWEGQIKFANVYPQNNFKLKLNTSDVKNREKNGTILVDARETHKTTQKSITPYQIALMETPSSKLESLYSQIPPNSEIITVCDEYTNCFMAKLVGLELQRRGHTFIGRYNEPWNY